ncbi:Dipeptide transport system permease protein DppC (TC 3.A.1.5.2), partial [Pseudomonas sp. FEN]
DFPVPDRHRGRRLVRLYRRALRHGLHALDRHRAGLSFLVL